MRDGVHISSPGVGTISESPSMPRATYGSSVSLIKITPTASAAWARRAFSTNGTDPRAMTATAPRISCGFVSAASYVSNHRMLALSVNGESHQTPGREMPKTALKSHRERRIG